MSNFKDIFKNIFMPENTQNYDFTIDPNVKDQSNQEENSNNKNEKYSNNRKWKLGSSISYSPCKMWK